MSMICKKRRFGDVFTVSKVCIINNNNMHVLENEINHHLRQYEAIIVACSYQTVGAQIFRALCAIYKQRLVDVADTYYRLIGDESVRHLQVPYYCKKVLNGAYQLNRVYVLNADGGDYEGSVDSCVESAFRTMRPRFVKELHLSELVPQGDLCRCDVVGEVQVSERRVRIVGGSLKIVNAIEADLDKTLATFVFKRYFVDDYMERIIDCDEPHIQEAISIITDCLIKYQPENVFLCFNGGKDCTVLLHLLLCTIRYRFSAYTAPPVCLYVEHRNPFPEICAFVHEMALFYSLEVITERRGIKDSLGNMLATYGGRMKACLMGTRNTDPFSNHLKHFNMTDPEWPKIMRVVPLLNWQYSQIWEYLRNYQVPYCCLYDRGYTSLGNTLNTLPNAALQYRNIAENDVLYMPAYKLLDGSLERNGRVANVS